MAPIDFINNIRFNDDNLCKSLMKTEGVIGSVTGDDESELEREIEAELDAKQPDEANNSSLLDLLDDLEPTPEGSCIICRARMACMLYLPCAHLATCFDCHETLRLNHEENAQRLARIDLRQEVPKMKCPICQTLADKAIQIRTNSYN